MKNYGLLLIPMLILVGCATITDLNSLNGTPIVPTLKNVQTQDTDDQQETEHSKTPTQNITEPPLLQSTNADETRRFDNTFGNQLAVVVEFPDQAIVVIDFESGESRRLREDGSFVFLDWVDKGCGLIIGDTAGNVGLVYKIDLQGNFLEEITRHDFQYLEGYLGIGVSDIYLSASGEYVAYIVSAYEDSSFRDPNLFNLYVSRVGDLNSTIAISQNDGVFDLSWSPVGSIIAFTDYDDTGILQIYVSEPEKSDMHL